MDEKYNRIMEIVDQILDVAQPNEVIKFFGAKIDNNEAALLIKK